MLARELGLNTEAARTIAGEGDHDWFHVGTQPGRLYTVALIGDVDALLEVFDSSGVVRIASDNRAISSASASFVAEGTEVFVRVRALRGTDVGAYVIRCDDIGVDDYFNDTSRAVTIGPDATFAGQVQYADDLDVVLLEVPVETAVEIGVDGGSPEIVIELSQLDAGRVLRLGDSTTVSFSTQSKLAISARAENRRDLVLFQVTTRSIGVDDHSDDPVFGTELVPNGAPVTGLISRDGADRDAFRVRQIQNHNYRARWTQIGNLSGLMGIVISPTGSILADAYTDRQVWEAMSSDSAAVVISRSPLSSTGEPRFSLVVEDLGIDDYGDSVVDASPLPAASLTARLETPDDVDVFRFDAIADHLLRVEFGQNPYAIIGTVLDGAGAELARNQPGVTNVGFVVPATGTYFVRIAAASPLPTDVLPFGITLIDEGTDDHGNTIANATPISLGTQIDARIQYTTDVDAFSFTASANQVYEVVCIPCRRQIRMPNGQTVTLHDPTFVANLPGQYTILIDSGVGALFDYTFSVIDRGLEDHGGTAATATALTVGTPLAGRIDVVGDIDVFSFMAQPGRIYQASAGQSGIVVAVYDAGWNEFARGNPVNFTAAPGPVYLVLTHFFALTNYTLIVTDVGTDDHGNTEATATPLTVGTAMPGEVQYSTDVEVFTAPVIGGHHFAVTCATASLCTVTVTTPTGTVLFDTVSNASIPFKVGSGLSNVTVTIRGAVGMVYSLTVSDLGLDDLGDDRGSASPLVVDGATRNGTLETPIDVDAFIVATAPGQIVRLSSSNADIEVLSPNDTSILRIDSDLAFATAFQSSGGGDWLVLVRNRLSFGPSVPFALTATSGVDDFAAPTPFTLTSPRTGSIDFAGDTDVFTVTLSAGTTPTTTITAGARVQVRNPSGQYVSVVGGGQSGSFFVATSGTYSFDVRGEVAGVLGSYTLLVQ